MRSKRAGYLKELSKKDLKGWKNNEGQFFKWMIDNRTLFTKLLVMVLKSREKLPSIPNKLLNKCRSSRDSLMIKTKYLSYREAI